MQSRIYNNCFSRKPWHVSWTYPELEHRKYHKADMHDDDYEEEVSIFFGDIHKHSSLSPCANVGRYNGLLEECYNHAQTRAGTDFLVITDHAERMTEEDWKRSMTVAETHTRPGSFIAWPGVETASGLYGHRNLYYKNYNAPLIRGQIDGRAVPPPEIWKQIRELKLDALTIPHHAARELAADLTRTDEELDVAYEIFSGWGNEEYYGAPLQDTERSYTRNFAVDTLLRGFKMGFVGGGDGHPASPADSGITGIYARDLSLDSLFEALRMRRTIATTGAQIKVDFHVNGFPIGSEIHFNQNQAKKLFPLEIGVAVQGTAAIEKVEIIENGISVHTKSKPRARMNEMSFTWYRQGNPDNGARTIGSQNNVSRFLYARITQRDGHMAWTSPIWLDFYYDE